MPKATARVMGMAIHTLSPTLSRNHAMMNAMAVEMVIRTLNSILSDEQTNRAFGFQWIHRTPWFCIGSTHTTES